MSSLKKTLHQKNPNPWYTIKSMFWSLLWLFIFSRCLHSRCFINLYHKFDTLFKTFTYAHYRLSAAGLHQIFFVCPTNVFNKRAQITSLKTLVQSYFQDLISLKRASNVLSSTSSWTIVQKTSWTIVQETSWTIVQETSLLPSNTITHTLKNIANSLL